MTQNNNSSNDQRSNTKNPNNSSHKSAVDNRSRQLNPNHRPSKGNSRKSR